MKALNLIGNRFGKLVVIIRITLGSGKSVWRCRCDCGKSVNVVGTNLTRGNTKSCGCYRQTFVRGNQLPDGERSFNEIFAKYQERAVAKNIPFRISKKFFFEQTQKDCFYCGGSPAKIKTRLSGKGAFAYNGLDRVDSKKGYLIGNVVPCCSRCNYMKLDMPAADFVSQCQKILDNQKKRVEESLRLSLPKLTSG